MTGFRSDARRAVEARRERALSAPAPARAPVVATLAITAVTALVLLVAGLKLGLVAAAAAVVIIAGACAAHRTTASLFAGLTLRVVRPYRPGERVIIYARERCAPVEAEIVRIGAVNTTLALDSGLIVVANVRLLRAAPECAD